MDKAIIAQSWLHHQLFLGLQLMVSTREGPDVIGDWMFRLFRRQHEDKFLSSFDKLGLSGEPHAVACAKYHVLSNSMGGVGVEYMSESDTKAWVRFRYPRWMYDGPAICGIPVEASRGFLRGWYAQNGVSLGNPRLGFVCVSEDMTGQFGLCGYFQEYEHELSEAERLRFAPDERPPVFDPDEQPRPPAAEWSEERLAKADRNYAMEYIRNAVPTLAEVVGRDRAVELGSLAARLIGMQNRAGLAEEMGAPDAGVFEAAVFMDDLLTGMGDEVSISGAGDSYRIKQSGLRIVRGMTGDAREDLLAIWGELYRGIIRAYRQRMELDWEVAGDTIQWSLSAA